MKASCFRYDLNFRRPSGTSRGVLTQKEAWFIVLEHQGKRGIGECGILRGLSADDRPDFEQKLLWVCANIDVGLNRLWEALVEFPSIQFGLEMAFRSCEVDNPFALFPSAFSQGTSGISINGLVWMGTADDMRHQLEQKIADGFTCVKLKIGAIDFEQELQLLRSIRRHFSPYEIEIRVDANGAFSASEATEKLKRLSDFQLHSIEQPIQPGHWEQMAELCATTPVPIALDEELIGVFDANEQARMLDAIRPQYVIFKPSFIGGFRGTQRWIDLADARGIGWWITSALESNIGLNAIAQFTYGLGSDRPQGLGTGALYTNNVESPLVVRHGKLWYDHDLDWDTTAIGF